jgi:zona occludens toxin (predicted ATPase)
MNRRRRTAIAAIALLGMAQSASAGVIVNRNMKAVNSIIVPDSELELLGVSVDHKTWEAPDGTIYRCDGGFYATTVKGQGTIWCNGKEL